MTTFKDCRKIQAPDSHARIITDATASYALQAMKEKAARGEYSGHHMFADDASFVRAAMHELEEAEKA